MAKNMKLFRFCLRCTEEIESGYLCETCAAMRRIMQAAAQSKPEPEVQPVEPERFYRVTANSCDLAESIAEAA